MEIMLGYGAHGLPYLREKIKSSIMHLFGKQSILISHWGQHELEQHYFATRKNTVIPLVLEWSKVTTEEWAFYGGKMG